MKKKLVELCHRNNNIHNLLICSFQGNYYVLTSDFFNYFSHFFYIFADSTVLRLKHMYFLYFFIVDKDKHTNNTLQYTYIM